MRARARPRAEAHQRHAATGPRARARTRTAVTSLGTASRQRCWSLRPPVGEHRPPSQPPARPVSHLPRKPPAWGGPLSSIRRPGGPLRHPRLRHGRARPGRTTRRGRSRGRLRSGDDERPRSRVPPPREGPRRPLLRRTARRHRARPPGARLAVPLQPPVQGGVRRDAAPVRPHAPRRTGAGTAPQHRPQRHRDLPRGRLPEPRVVQHRVPQGRGNDPDRVPRDPHRPRAAHPRMLGRRSGRARSGAHEWRSARRPHTIR